jgi:hypothetical protein
MVSPNVYAFTFATSFVSAFALHIITCSILTLVLYRHGCVKCTCFHSTCLANELQKKKNMQISDICYIHPYISHFISPNTMDMKLVMKNHNKQNTELNRTQLALYCPPWLWSHNPFSLLFSSNMNIVPAMTSVTWKSPYGCPLLAC